MILSLKEFVSWKEVRGQLMWIIRPKRILPPNRKKKKPPSAGRNQTPAEKKPPAGAPFRVKVKK